MILDRVGGNRSPFKSCLVTIVKPLWHPTKDLIAFRIMSKRSGQEAKSSNSSLQSQPSPKRNVCIATKLGTVSSRKHLSLPLLNKYCNWQTRLYGQPDGGTLWVFAIQNFLFKMQIQGRNWRWFSPWKIEKKNFHTVSKVCYLRWVTGIREVVKWIIIP